MSWSSKKKDIENLKAHIKYTDDLIINEKNSEIHPYFKEIKEKIDKGEYKGIIIYPLAVNWEPVQRPHHFLRKFGEKGYLCFFCESNENENLEIIEKYKNVYLINKQEKLLPLIGDNEVIFLITYFLQYLYAKHFKNRIIWLDVLDKLEFMSSYNKYSKKIYDELIEVANITTYSANNLKKYLKTRSDAILLENAVNLEDFNIDKIGNIPKDMLKCIDKSKKTIGYYGAVEKWFDFDLIKKIDEYYNIIIIGNVGKNLNLRKYKFKNVHFLGAKPFNELKKYAIHFDVAIIPFKINSVTNCVSPVKFYEYISLYKPVITTNIKEMKKYECSIVKIVNKRNINKEINNLLNVEKKEVKEMCNLILSNNTWDKRVDKIREKF